MPAATCNDCLIMAVGCVCADRWSIQTVSLTVKCTTFMQYDAKVLQLEPELGLFIRPNQSSIYLKRKMDKAGDAKGKGFVHQPQRPVVHQGGPRESASEQRKACEEGACQNISMWPAGMRRGGRPQQRTEEIRLCYTEEVRCRRCHRDVFREIKRWPGLSNTFNVVRKIIISLRSSEVQEEQDKTSMTQRKSLTVTLVLSYFPPRGVCKDGHKGRC